MKQYKLVEGPTTTQILGKNGSNADAVNSFQTIINNQVSQGWAYNSMESIRTVQTKGCLFNKTTVEQVFYMLIFEREA